MGAHSPAGRQTARGVTAAVALAASASLLAGMVPANSVSPSTAGANLATASAALASGQPASNIFDGSDAPLSEAALQTPAAQYRPATRWWWSGPMSVTESVRELNAIADAGFGEVEIAFSTDVWANDTQRSNLRAVMEAAKERDVVVSMTMGAAWPLQTPNTGLGTGYSQQELQYGRADVKAGATFNAAPPRAIDASRAGKGGGSLLAVTVGRVLEAGPAAELYGPNEKPRYIKSDIKPPASSTVLDPDSLQDITARVQADGTVNWTAPEGDGDWILFAFWQRDAGPYTSFLDREAAEKATEYLTENQLGAANQELFKEVGGSMFEDSLELNADSLFWAPLLPEVFESKAGYDMIAHLPLMYAHGMSRYWLPNEEPTPDFELPNKDGLKVRTDYYRLLTDMYIDDHLRPLQEWSEELGVKHKAQAAYGQNLEPIRSFRELARAGGEVEGESYNSGDRWPINIDHMSWRFSLDWQRVVTSGAHQANVNSVSSELGAQQAVTHMVNVGDYQEMMDKEWAAGLTKPFLHGYQYMSVGAPWPGKYRFGDTGIDSFNDINNPQWPMFENQTAYWARGTQILETGTARTDVAIYRDGFLTTAARNQQRDEGTQPERLFNALPLEREGYSVGFVDPVGLAEDGVVKDGVLFADGPAYGSLIIDERTLPLDAAEAIAEAAQSGVRVVFVGDLPNADKSYGSGSAGDAAVRAAVAKALTHDNVAQVAYQRDAAAALKRLDAASLVKWEDNTHVLTQVRDTDGVRYVYLYNPTNSEVSFDPSFEGAAAPSEIDLWSGESTELAGFKIANGRTSVPLHLKAKEGVVIALDERDDIPVHVVSGPKDAAFTYDSDGRIELAATESGTYSIELSNGVQRNISVTAPRRAWASVAPRLWNISVEAFTPTGKKNITLPAREGARALWDWRDIPEVAHESGIGTYDATFDLPSDWTSDAAAVVLNLGEVAGTAEIAVNGQPVGAQSVDDKDWDITSALKPGQNQLRVTVRTTMRNAVTHYNKIFTRTQTVGLLGGVRIEPVQHSVVFDPAAPASTSTTAVTSAVRGTFGQAVRVPVRVTAEEGSADGEVQIRRSGRVLATATARNGAATVVIPARVLNAGTHRLHAVYLGAERIEGSSIAFSAQIGRARPVLATGLPQVVSRTAQPLLRVRATAPGAVPRGLAQVYVDNRLVARRWLDETGRVELRLPRAAAGTHRVRVVLPTSQNFGTATAARTYRVSR